MPAGRERSRPARCITSIVRSPGRCRRRGRPTAAVWLRSSDTHARRAASRFCDLTATDQDSVLIDVETGSATGSGAGFDGSSAAVLRAGAGPHAAGDVRRPFYGGNANFVGWDLLGYPGVRTAVTPDEQRLGVAPRCRCGKSAYDSDMFNKATVGMRRPRGPPHGDDAEGHRRRRSSASAPPVASPRCRWRRPGCEVIGLEAGSVADAARFRARRDPQQRARLADWRCRRPITRCRRTAPTRRRRPRARRPPDDERRRRHDAALLGAELAA